MAWVWSKLSFYTTVYVACLMMSYWHSKLGGVVQEPYLDEFFHVGQARAYWRHQWGHWDPKITTPPGLYLWSYLFCRLVSLVAPSTQDLSVQELRLSNWAGLFVLLQLRLRKLLEILRKPAADSADWDMHFTILNICLFPPLFFVSGLYYTDLAAMFIVIESYICDQKASEYADESRNSRAESGLFTKAAEQFSWRNLRFLTCGLLSLLFRQTNIFWVAVFLGGLQVVRTLRRETKPCVSSNMMEIMERAWYKHEIYDPPVAGAGFEDYFKATLSLGIAALAHLPSVLLALVPYFIILASFGLFVLWNGSVVLGHKEFHTAGLHLPQMLYIWPYFMFFSWPVMAVPLVNTFLPRSLSLGGSRFEMPRTVIILGLIPVMLAIVHVNTIVHPFTLADNRHYVFYVFRILLRHPAIRYAATPVYFLCGWAVLSTFGNTTASLKSKAQTSKAEGKKTKGTHHTGAGFDSSDVHASFVLIWFVSTALSLITAPLVEPRYFIIPWVIWRLHIPARVTTSPSNTEKTGKESGKGNSREPVWVAWASLILEFLWFATVNFVTGYVFLYKGFEWPQEPGKVQRFMW